MIVKETKTILQLSSDGESMSHAKGNMSAMGVCAVATVSIAKSTIIHSNILRSRFACQERHACHTLINRDRNFLSCNVRRERTL